ncbi:uncharacterized protein N7511_006620 [Penicillium nucicola]|uniref:uncharacterized protein n=1 Tax=Penicillium nucicola TaxID=1850975 RepID=UPI002544D39A|nr:uncharacterized protein N7511_006620 [Penicillium nucicola]KAJ5757926.1 hypothetical protein N7511_006620 [Penicillium nucicola]
MSRTATALTFPRFIVVEPKEADCLLQSAVNGEARQSEGSLHTIMAGLACRAPSPAAWKLLTWLASDFVAVPDSVTVDGMRALANANEGDIPVICGESSAASLGVVLVSATEAGLRKQLGLDHNSQAIFFALEGATDPSIYESLVGKSPHSVFDAQKLFLTKVL